MSNTLPIPQFKSESGNGRAVGTGMDSEMVTSFEENGFLGPINVLSRKECKQLSWKIRWEDKQPALDWSKGWAATSRSFYEIATHPSIIERVQALIGENVLLWGSAVLVREPNRVHPWHSDVESSAFPGKTVSVWLGLKNTHRDSSLLVVPHSHSFGTTIQEERYNRTVGRETVDNDTILEWAREKDDRCQLQALDMSDGDALFFDGKLWHGSHNLRPKTRVALLLQYASPEMPVRIPDYNFLDWPLVQKDVPRPPCIMVRGSSESDVNRIVQAPVARGNGSKSQLTGSIYRIPQPIPIEDDKDWRPVHIFDGCTSDIESLTCHVSTLRHDISPHPPHEHQDEEILIVLSGEVDLLLTGSSLSNDVEEIRLTEGQFVYYPSQFGHTLRTASREAADYLMFKWRGDPTGSQTTLEYGLYDLAPLFGSEDSTGYSHQTIVEGETNFLRKLQCHSSILKPGAGYDEHVDAYDVAIIVFEGEVETLNERIGPRGVIFYPAGCPHGMHNPGSIDAKYLVIEFHGSQSSLEEVFPSRLQILVSILADPKQWRRIVRSLKRRLFGSA